MGRTPCCEKVGLKKGPWTPEEDQKLLAFIDAHGHGSWRALPSKAGLRRCGKSCRLRWTNYLRPDIKRGKFSAQEEQTIIQLHAFLGNRWSAIASQLPKRTDNEIKNYWNTNIRKRLTKMGIDPITHKRITTAPQDSGQASKNIVANLSHMAQWENARLQAESRLVREAKLVANPNQIIQQNSSARLVCRPSSTLEPLMRPRPHCLDVLKAWQGIILDKALHGDYYNYTLESPTSTLNFSEVGSLGTFLPNQSMAPPANYADYNLSTGCNNINDQGMVMIVKQNHDQLEIMEPNKMENSIELHNDDMISSYPINCTTMEGLMDDLVDHNGSGANGHNLITGHSAGGNFEENSWNNLLNNLANFSPPSGSPIFDLTPP